MAWSYFTGPLASGDELTMDMLSELHAGLAERELAANSVTTDATMYSAWQTSRLPTAKLWYASGTSPRLLHIRAQELATRFQSDASAATPYANGAALIAAASSSLGITTTVANNHITAATNGTDTAVYWNLVREMIIALKYLILQPSASLQQSRSSGNSPSWASAKTAFASGLSGTSAASGSIIVGAEGIHRGSGSNPYLLTSGRLEASVSNIGSNAPLNSSTVDLYLAVPDLVAAGSDGQVFDSVNVTATTGTGSLALNAAAATVGSYWSSAGSGDLAGLTKLNARMTAFDLTDLDRYEPYFSPGTTINILSRLTVSAVRILPSWTHP